MDPTVTRRLPETLAVVPTLVYNTANIKEEACAVKRRAFFRAAGLAGLAAPIAGEASAAYTASHNWDKYDFGSGPPVKDRLYQGPFPQYPPEQIFPGGCRHGDNALGASPWPCCRRESRPCPCQPRCTAKIDEISRRIGYNVRPSFVWAYEGDSNGLVIGFANDGIAGVPGVLRVSVCGEDGVVHAADGLDAGYPLPGKIRQAQFPLPKDTAWQGLRLKAELDVKGVLHPVRWACHQKTNPDGSLTLRRNVGQA